LLKEEISRFSIDKLISMLARAGLQARLETKPRAAQSAFAKLPRRSLMAPLKTMSHAASLAITSARILVAVDTC
jgi:hypothetical protein